MFPAERQRQSCESGSIDRLLGSANLRILQLRPSFSLSFILNLTPYSSLQMLSHTEKDGIYRAV